jgi:hypothetical protein
MRLSLYDSDEHDVMYPVDFPNRGQALDFLKRYDITAYNLRRVNRGIRPRGLSEYSAEVLVINGGVLIRVPDYRECPDCKAHVAPIEYTAHRHGCRIARA